MRSAFRELGGGNAMGGQPMAAGRRFGERVLSAMLAAAAAWAIGIGLPADARAASTLVVAHTLDAPTLDPHQTSWREARIITHQIFDFLLTSTPDGVHPGLATKWEASPDGKTWTFTLRTDAKFHDGTPVDAQAVKFNFERLVELGPKAGGLSALGSVIERVEAPSNAQVRVVLKNPYGGFLNLVGGELFGIVSPAAVKKYGPDFGRNPVGSGPFVFRKWVTNDQVVLAKNPDYRWGAPPMEGAGPARIDEVVYRVIPEAATFTASLETGETHVLDFVSPTDVVRLQRLNRFDVTIQTTPGVPASYFFNTQREPTSDARVRKAIAYAIDRTELQQAAALGHGLVPIAYSYLTKTNWGHNAELEASKPYAHDRDRAAKLLDEAGWRLGPDGVRTKNGQRLRLVVLEFAALPIYGATDLIVQSQLRKLGIETEIRRLDQGSLMGAIGRGEHNMTLFSAGGYDPDACMFRTFHSTGGSNFARYKNEKVDQLLVQGAREGNAERRRAIYRQVQEAILEDMPVLPMYVYAGIVVRDRKATGIWFDPRSGFKLHNTAVAR